MNDKSLNLSVIFCSFILSEKYLIVKKYQTCQKKRSNVEDSMTNNKKKVPYLVNLLEQP